MSLILKSIDEEASDCRAAFVGSKVGDLVLHCHHEIVCEVLSEPAGNRIAHILKKPTAEQALRLRLFRPLKAPHAELAKACTELVRAAAEASKAHTEMENARAGLHKVRKLDELDTASGEWNKARAGSDKAEAELAKAYIELDKACAKWGKERHHAACVDGCPWNGRTIF